MFGKYKKQIEELTELCKRREEDNHNLKYEISRHEAANKELNECLDKAHVELANATKETRHYRDAFEGSLAAIKSLLEDEATKHKRPTEYMRGLIAAKATLEVYTDAN